MRKGGGIPVRFAAFAAAAMIAATLAAPAAFAEVTRVDVLDRGIYEIVPGEQTPDPDTPTGTITAVDTQKLLQSTDTVVGKLGVEFGLRYVVIGSPEGGEVTVDLVYIYPSPGLKDPAEAEPALETRFSRTKKIGETTYIGYGFENDWEIVPGEWRFEIWHDGKKLAEESFTVTAE
jgi:hypothetical protein